MEKEFYTHLTKDEVIEFITKNTKAWSFSTILTSPHPERLYLEQKGSLLKLYFLQGKRIMPVFFCSISPYENVTRIAGRVGFDKHIYFLMWWFIVFGIYLISKATTDPSFVILPLGFVLGSSLCLVNLKYGKRVDKLNVETCAVELIKKIAEPRK